MSRRVSFQEFESLQFFLKKFCTKLKKSIFSKDISVKIVTKSANARIMLDVVKMMAIVFVMPDGWELIVKMYAQKVGIRFNLLHSK